MRSFSLLVKPAGAECNLACPYCFYREKASLHADPHPRMDDVTAGRMLSSYRALPIVEHAVTFQGGEPLLMGEGFFRLIAEWGGGIAFSLQTNATLVTDSLARLFAEKNWLIGVSPHGDTPEFRRGYERLVDAGAAVNVLQLVTRENVGEPERLYRFIRDELGCRHHQYIECTSPEAYAVTGEEWGTFLIRLFDTWMGDGDMRTVSVRTFDSLVSQLLGEPPALCSFARDCRHYLVVEANGDVYPCDFYVEPEWRLGNVLEDSWEKLAASPVYAAFGARKRGFPDCPRNGGRLDEGWRRFYAHAVPILRDRLSRGIR